MYHASGMRVRCVRYVHALTWQVYSKSELVVANICFKGIPYVMQMIEGFDDFKLANVLTLSESV